jgi:hypothetical protein
MCFSLAVLQKIMKTYLEAFDFLQIEIFGVADA